MRETKILLCVLFICVSSINCRKEYKPAVLTINRNFLVVDGFINTASEGITTIFLSRSRLLDSTANVPEPGAVVAIQDENGIRYPAFEQPSTGTYASNLLTLDPSKKYQINIQTGDGHSYASEFTVGKPAPPIDSIFWSVSINPLTSLDQLDIKVTTHDPANVTRYYRWTYEETWQNNAHFETLWGLNGNTIYPATTETNNYKCWKNAPSYNTILGSSASLTSDLISGLPVAHFEKDDAKFDVRYSILVNQYALDLTSYNYWLTIQKNSQTLGSLFAPQPSQVTGNVKSVSDPNETVIGFVSVGQIQQQRIFIDNSELPGWKSTPFSSCPVREIPANPLDYTPFNYPDTSFAPYFFAAMGSILNITKKECVDCRRLGGDTNKPSFW